MAKRGKAFESKHFHDKELNFKIEARGRKFFAMWAAEEICGEDEEETLEYALNMVKLGVSEGSDVVLEKIQKDLQKAGLEYDMEDLRSRKAELIEAAAKKIREELEEE